MPLSDHEQRILDEIAKQLAEEDPRFAQSVRSATPRSHALRRLRLAAFGAIAGLGVLVAGLFLGLENSAITIGFGFVGFLVMLAGVLAGVRAFRALGNAVVIEVREKRGERAPRVPRRSLRERLDERWQRRIDGDAN